MYLLVIQLYALRVIRHDYDVLRYMALYGEF